MGAKILGARVIGTPAKPTTTSVRSAPNPSPTAMASSSLRQLAPEGADAVLDLVGGKALDAAPEIVRNPSRLASVVAPGATELGGRFVVVRAGCDRSEGSRNRPAPEERSTSLPD